MAVISIALIVYVVLEEFDIELKVLFIGITGLNVMLAIII